MPSRQSGAGLFLGRSAAGFAGLVLIGLLFTVMLAAGADTVRSVDHLVADHLNGVVAPNPALAGALTAVTVLGATPTAGVVLSTLAAALLIRRRGRLAVYVAVTALGGAVLSPAIKELVGRLRPAVPAPIATAGGPSFPSGHATTVTIMVGVLLLVLLPTVPARWRRAVVVAGIVVVVLVGFTRIALGLHFVSDVLAGWLLGAVWVALTATAFREWRRVEGLGTAGLARGLEPEAGPDLVPAPEHEPPPSPWVRASQLLVAAVVLLAVLLGAGWLVTREPGGDVGGADVAVVAWLAEHRTSALDAPSAWAADLGATIPVFALGSVAAALAVAALRRWWPAVLLAVALVGELALFLTAATITNRPRPPVTHLDAALPPTSSFPSGHTAAAICLYGGVAVIVLVATRAWWRSLVLAGAVVLVVAIALARLYRGAHHPTDVLGSVLMAVPWLLMTARVVIPRPRGDDVLHNRQACSTPRARVSRGSARSSSRSQ